MSEKLSCPHVPTCELFALIEENTLLGIWKRSYCDADFTRCARHLLSASGKVVPPTLLPNGKELSVPLKKGEPR